MRNQDLVNFIKKSKAAGETSGTIKAKLREVGWQSGDIEENFEAAEEELLEEQASIKPHTFWKKALWGVLFFLIGVILVVVLVASVFNLSQIERKLLGWLPLERFCEDKCGDGICQNKTCLTLNCPCPENKSNCSEDCREENTFEEEWLEYEKMLGFIENQDLSGFNSVTYDKYNSEVLSQKGFTTEEEFWQFAEKTALAENYYKNDFSLIAKDENQTVLASEIEQSEKDGSVIYSRDFMVFIKNPEGRIRILSISSKSFNDKNYFNDSDKDGRINMAEDCRKTSENMPEEYLKDCIKTNPNQKDTDGDGWWDGVEAAGNYVSDPGDPESILYKIK